MKDFKGRFVPKSKFQFGPEVDPRLDKYQKTQRECMKAVYDIFFREKFNKIKVLMDSIEHAYERFAEQLLGI